MAENEIPAEEVLKERVVSRMTKNARNILRRMASIKVFFLALSLVVMYVALFHSNDSNTVYKHYNIILGHNEGLTVTKSQQFLLNGKPLWITSGLIYYWRVHPHQWRNRLKKLRAAGAIAVKTDIPWNLHEPSKDVYDFGDGSSEMSAFLDIVKFIQIAREEDLLVILGLGPYINAQMDLGGLPSYLLSEGMKLRTSDPKFLARVYKYFGNLLPLLVPLQVQLGGPVIMFQLENSYGLISAPEIDKVYLEDLKRTVEQSGVKGLLVTSDPVSATLDRGALPQLGVLQTVNSETDVLSELETLHALQPMSPILMHLRSGCLDHWNWPSHNTWPTHEYVAALTEALQFPASVCIHVLHGGTNFGFLNGATGGDTPDVYHPHTTSFDFDAPLTEAGDYTAKYEATLELFRAIHPTLHHPDPPAILPRTLELTLPLTQELPWTEIVRQLPVQVRRASSFVFMEDMPAVDGRKQSYGYIRYLLKFHAITRHFKVKLLGRKRDIAMMLVDGQTVGPKRVTETKRFGFWDSDDELLQLDASPGVHQLELLVENCGRVSHSHSLAWLADKKGLGPDNKVLFQSAYPIGKGEINISGMPFLPSWVLGLTGWSDRVRFEEKCAPSLVKANFHLSAGQISDTFMDISDWGKGLVFINGFNIGCYFCGSPQQTLYIPSPLLKEGENTIIIFEHYFNPHVIKLTTEPVFLF